MSKGPGKWQRMILEELERRRAFYVADLLPDGYSRSDYSALIRAAYKLLDAGRVELTRYMCWGSAGRKLAVSFPGVAFDRDELRLKVDKVTEGNIINT